MDEAHITTGLKAWALDCRRLTALLLTLLLSTVSWHPHAGEAQHLLILQSHASTPYKRLAELVRAGVAETALVVEVRTPEQITSHPTSLSPGLILAIGTHASRFALEHWSRTPILTILLPSQVFAKLSTGRRQRVEQGLLSAIYLDQPIERQFRFIGTLLPQTRAIGTLYGNSSLAQSRELERLTRASGLDFHGLDGGQANLSRTIRRLARLSDVILALPDRSVMTPNHAKWLLYIAYQHRTPVIAFSRNYVEAGALAALYTAPEQIARQASTAIRHFLEAPSGRQRLQRPAFPSDFSIAINRHVAHSLGIELPSIAAVKRRLEDGERAPAAPGDRP